MANLGLNLVVDNDVIFKCACYGVLDEIGTKFLGEIGILGAARYVVRGLLNRDARINDPNSALTKFDSFLLCAVTIEPTASEIVFATRIEEIAINANLELDPGESQLCAVLVERGLANLITGDKRAICALEALKSSEGFLNFLAGRVICLEQLILAIGLSIGLEDCRARVCAEPMIDKALTASFSCHSISIQAKIDESGLVSYIDSLRLQAMTVLHPHNSIFT